MKERISITLDSELLSRLDRKIGQSGMGNRSQIVERLIKGSLDREGMDTAILLCGGRSPREMASGMMPLGGRPLLEHHLEHLDRQGFRRVIFAAGPGHEEIVSHFGNRFGGLELQYSIEEDENGTGGCLRNISQRSTFVVLNGDVLSAIDFEDMLRIHRKTKALSTMALTTVKEVSRYGVAIVTGNTISGFIEKVSGPVPSHLINAGAYLVEPTFVAGFSKEGAVSLEREFRKLSVEGKLSAYIYGGLWFDCETGEQQGDRSAVVRPGE